jgi:hypothetical protein
MSNAVCCVVMGQANNGQPMTDRAADRRVTVSEAALLLGVSEDAVRSRLKRGTLRRETGSDGTVLVVLGPEGAPNRPTTNRNQPATDQHPKDMMQEHLDSLQDQIVHLRQQLDEAHEANRENRRIIAGLVQRVPELEPAREAPPEPPEAPENASAGPEGVEVPLKEERPPWWRRWFGQPRDFSPPRS